MAKLENARREAFAQARATGATVVEASRAAGYVVKNCDGGRVARNPAVMARVAEIQQAAIGETRDLPVLISKMVAMADAAAELGSAAGMREAKALLVEAARLKGLLPPSPARPPQPPMSRAEWMARFAPGL